MTRGIFQAIGSRPALALAASTLVLLTVRGAGQSFWAFDEGWYAQQARWILQNGDWITQHWWGTLQYDRGMGLQWLIAASYALFGYSETAARLPTMLSALGCTLLTFAIARECVERRTAILAAAILSATPIWMQAARLAMQDVPLVFFELLGIWALLRAERPEARRLAWGVLAGATVGLGFMVKTLMVVPALAAMAPYLLLEHRRHRHLVNPGLYLGLLLGFVPFVVWMGLSVEAYGWHPLKTLFGKLSALSDGYHGEGPLYYFWNVPATAFPWPLLAVPGFVLALRGSAESRRRWLWIGYPLVLFAELTLFSTRVWYYGLQLLPFLSIAASVALMQLADAYRGGRLRWPVIASWMLAAVGAALAIMGAALLGGLADIGLRPAWAFGGLGLAAGLAWLVPLATILSDRRKGDTRSAGRWVAGWLLGPSLAIFVAYATGLWGDYSAGIKKSLEDEEIKAILDGNPVDFLLPGVHGPGSLEDIVLLTLYTPDPNRRHADLAAVPAGGVAWVHDDTLKSVAPAGYEVLGEVRSWNLIRVGAR